uniref:Uncharacterized protein n=1 Tax=Anguilla anguilla TaxID=7936 RepID=A0A0E9UJ22_ANGAN
MQERTSFMVRTRMSVTDIAFFLNTPINRAIANCIGMKTR